MKITAKAKLGSKILLSNGDYGLYFHPDYYGDKAEVNKAWATASPSLSFQMQVTEAAAANFEQGASYTVTFEQDVVEKEVKDGSDSPA
jgi:hypothetical protein